MMDSELLDHIESPLKMDSIFADLDDDVVPSQHLLTDEIWDKFQFSSIFNFPELPQLSNDIDIDSIEMFASPCPTSEGPKIRHHDCMWAGHCGSKEHSHDDSRTSFMKPLAPMPMFMHPQHSMTAPVPAAPAAPTVHRQHSTHIAPGRSLLLKTQPQHQQQLLIQQQQQQQQVTTQVQMFEGQHLLPNYESPPNSDDEECKSSVLKYLQDAISECDMDDDDLYDYFDENKDLIGEDFEEEEEEAIVEMKYQPPQPLHLQQQPQQQQQPNVNVHIKTEVVENNHNDSNNNAASNQQNNSNNNKSYNRSATISQFVNDHSYFKDKNASMRNLGIDTPSDSEEEIDVVTTDDKLLMGQQQQQQQQQRVVGGALPTNPTTRDRHQLQKTMATAITKNGIRTLPPARKTIAGELAASMLASPTKRGRVAGGGVGGGIKRQRHSPYKKQRAYHHHHHSSMQPTTSSDSEQEPSEKRIEHNNMERQRRIDLRNAFEELRVLVPEVSNRERAPKVVILRSAALYCHKLTDVSDGMKRQVEEMRRQQRRLRARLSQLRLSLAPKHR